MSGTKACLILALLAGSCGSGAHGVAAQERRPAQPPAATSAQQSAPPSTQTKTNDLEITANVTADELRFEVVPEVVKVEFTGQPRRDTVWEAERQNLPRPVQPGVTYRNIGIQLKIISVFADIDRIVAEALGEIPVTDETPVEVIPPQSKATPVMAPPSTTQGRKP